MNKNMNSKWGIAYMERKSSFVDMIVAISFLITLNIILIMAIVSHDKAFYTVENTKVEANILGREIIQPTATKSTYHKEKYITYIKYNEIELEVDDKSYYFNNIDKDKCTAYLKTKVKNSDASVKAKWLSITE